MKTPSFLLTAVLLFACGDLSAAIPAATSAASPEAVVRADVAALSRGDVDGLVALFSTDSQVFKLPTQPRRLVGELSLTLSGRETMRAFLRPRMASGAPDRYELIDMTSIGELVLARLKVTAASNPATPGYSLVAYRVRDGLIRDLWHIAHSERPAVLENAPAQAVVAQLVAANNRGDVDAFLALFDPDARNFRRADVTYRLSNQLSSKIVDHASRGEVFRAMFASGAPVQVEAVQTLVFGDLVVAREIATKPDGQLLDELSIYRVRDGRIVDDWFVAAVER